MNNDDHSSDQKSVVALTKNNNENVERSKVLQSFLPVQVWSENNSVRVSTYALLDTGLCTTTSLCTTSLVNKLNISINREPTELHGVNSINRCSGRIAPLSVIKRILNDKPIIDVSTDPKDLSALTPNMLLNGVVEASLPADVYSKSDLYRRSRRKGQILGDRFWSRWISEYLPMLQPRRKWFGVSPNINVGDLVLVKDDSVKKGCWPKVIVDECYPDAEGLVRRVRV